MILNSLHLCDDMCSFKNEVFNHSLHQLDLKLTKRPSDADLEKINSIYQRVYVPEMNKMIPHFKNKKFNNVDNAVCVLTMAIRSYVTGFSVHRRKTYPLADGTKVVKLQCHTLNNSRKRPSENFEENPTGIPSTKCVDKCHWSATIHFNGEYAQFKQIDEFSVHGKECLAVFSRMTTCEVDVHSRVNHRKRKLLMADLMQRTVRCETLIQRRFRTNSAGDSIVNREILTRIEGEKMDESVTNIEEVGAEPDDEVNTIMKYLATLKHQFQYDVDMKFVRNENGAEVKYINLMSPEGHDLLRTHGDVIFCDSMWNVSCNGYFALTIVVVDENRKLRLAAICLSKEEKKESWTSFFEWVKITVPEFNPDCIVTDGAKYIDTSFNSVMGTHAVHIICWWHQRENIRMLIPRKKPLRRLLLNMTYASTIQELNSLKSKAENYAHRKNLLTPSLKNIIEHCFATALISLNLFTGGTVTNSYSESINSVLRDAGLRTDFSLFFVIQATVNFFQENRHPTVWPFSPNNDTLAVLPDTVLQTVSNGVLDIFQSSLREASRSCSFVKCNPESATVRETVSFRESRLKTVTKDVDWEVTWKNDVPSCSCNKLVYCGMPCMHIAYHALNVGKSIPLCCFHKRFYAPAMNFDDEFNLQQGSPVCINNGRNESNTADSDDTFYIQDGGDETDVEGDDENDSDDDDETEFEGDDENEIELGNDNDNDNDNDIVNDKDEDSSGDAEEELSASVDAMGDTVHRIPIKSFLPVIVNGKEEMLLYQMLQSTTDTLVNCYRNHKEEAEKMENELSVMTKVLVAICNSVTSEADSSLKRTEIILDTEGVDLDKLIPITLVCSPETKDLYDDLHIASASMNSHEADEPLCIFRGKLLAKIIILLLANRINHSVAQGSIDIFLNSIKQLVNSFPVCQGTVTATVARVAGRLTRKSYKLIPGKIGRYCIDELIQSSSNGSTLIPLQSSSLSSSQPEDEFQPVTKKRRYSHFRKHKH